MEKDFDKWNIIKKQIELYQNINVNEGELWWCNVGLNIGSEQDGPCPLFERPVFIAKRFSDRTCLVFPMTSKIKTGSYYYTIDTFNTIILCQPKLIDTKRLKRIIRKLNRSETKKIIYLFKNLL